MLETYAAFLGTINSIGWLIGGVICSALGILFILDHILMVRKSWLVSGVISDVVKEKSDGGHIYFPVISFRDPLGRRHNIKSDFGTNRIEGKSPGTKVTLYFRPDKPEVIRLKNLVWFYFSLAFLAGGFILTHFYLAAYDMTEISLLAGGISMAILLTGFFVRPMSGYSGRPIMGNEDRASDDEILSREEQAAVLSVERRRNPKAGLLLLLIAGALIITGIYIGKSQWQVTLTYAKTTGQVINHELIYAEHAGKRNYYYYPIVRFTAPDGNAVRFQDKQGSSAPSFKKNQPVAVFYNPDNPSDALIDRGLENWLFPLLMLFAGMIFGIWGLKILSKKG